MEIIKPIRGISWEGGSAVENNNIVCTLRTRRVPRGRDVIIVFYWYRCDVHARKRCPPKHFVLSRSFCVPRSHVAYVRGVEIGFKQFKGPNNMLKIPASDKLFFGLSVLIGVTAVGRTRRWSNGFPDDMFVTKTVSQISRRFRLVGGAKEVFKLALPHTLVWDRVLLVLVAKTTCKNRYNVRTLPTRFW
jgi:hypothetical protein